MNDFSLYPNQLITKTHQILSVLVILLVTIPQTVLASVLTSQNIIDLTNTERIKNGQATLAVDSQLSDAAFAKAQNMIGQNYFDHFGPNGETPWQYILSNGYVYHYAGENLAMNFDETENVVTAWMKSATHRDNILDPNYQDIGVAVLDGVIDGQSTTLIVQMFAAKPASLIDQAASKISVVEYVGELLGINN